MPSKEPARKPRKRPAAPKPLPPSPPAPAVKPARQMPAHERESASDRRMIAALAVAALAVIGVSAYFAWPRPTAQPSAPITPSTNSIADQVAPKPAYAAGFAQFEETPTDIRPSVAPYAVAADLSNVSNAAQFTFTPEASALLAKNAFVVVPGYGNEFFELYERDRYSYVPNFVTTDSLLHNYHLVFDHLLKKVEEEKLVGALTTLNANMMAETEAQYDKLKGTEWENAARRDVGFFAVGSALLTPNVAVPDYVKGEVDQELALIAGHSGIAVSPLMNIGETPDPVNNLKEDYSQYVPRGHYDKTEQLKAYFKSMMWYGRLTFRLKENDEIRSAALITFALEKGDNKAEWNTIYEPTNFFVGKSDDITYYQLSELLDKDFGADAGLEKVTGDADAFAAFVADAQKLAPPQINSVPIFNAAIQPDREKEIKGFRFMGQRFTVDANIFQRLVYREVDDRYLPKALDIPAAMGSDEALAILDKEGDTKFGNYSANMTKMRAWVAGLGTDTWTQNLYWGWMYTLRPLTAPRGQGYPSFMTNQAWVRKDLNTYVSSWTELKHDTILYAKQVYAELGGGPPDQHDDRGYVEPNAEVYARLASLLGMTSEGLELRGLLSADMKDTIGKMRDLSLSLKVISEKELRNETLSDDEYELIRSYGGQLEHFWLEVNREEMEAVGVDERNYLDQNPAALVTDVATDPNGKVLEEAIGPVNEIYAVVPVDGALRIAKGATFSHYEFPWPLSDRLTDQRWRDIMRSEDRPDLPEWTSAFTVGQ